MNRVLLDTSAYSTFMKGSPEALAAIQTADEIYLNPVVVGELLSGFLRGSRTTTRQRQLQEFLASPRVRAADVDETTSERYAVILNSLWTAGTPLPTNDIWIAATAMQHGLQVVTQDAHYQKIAQIVVHHLAGFTP